MRYSAKVTLERNSNMSLRKDHNTSAETLAQLNAGKIAEGDELWTATADGTNVRKGDTWLHVLKADGQPVDLWIAIVHMGALYCTLTDNDVSPTPTPTPESPFVAAILIREDGTTSEWDLKAKA